MEKTMKRNLLLRNLALMFTITPSCAVHAGEISFNDSMLFTTTGQSQWASGAAAEFNTHGPQFVGIAGAHVGDSVGEMLEECVLGICARFGAKLGLTGDVRAGLNYDVKISNGSLTITVPQTVNYTLPTADSIKQGGVFEIATSLVPSKTYYISSTELNVNSIKSSAGPGLTAVGASLKTTGPMAEALVSLDLDAHFQAIAQVCWIVACAGPNLETGITPPIRQQELLALNHNGDRQLRVLGQPVVSAETAHSFDDGAIAVSAQLPVLNSDSGRRLNGFDVASGNLNSGNRANVATLTARLDKIVTELLGLPPLNGTAAGFGYNILTADAGLSIDVKQEFTFDPDLRARLDFTSPVIMGNGGVFDSGTATRSVNFRPGDTLSLRANSALVLGIAPVYTLDNQTRNQTGLQVDGNVHVSAFGVSSPTIEGYGASIGPLLQQDADGGIGYIPLFDNTFRVNTAEIRTDPFNLKFAFQRDSAFADEKSCLGVFVSCDRMGYFNVEQPCPLLAATCTADFPLANNIFLGNDLYGFLGCNASTPCGFDAFGRAIEMEGGNPFVHYLSTLADTQFIGATSVLGIDDTGDKVYFSDSLAAVRTNSKLALEVKEGTDQEAQKRLAGLGFTDQYPQFDVPAGAVVSAPEPPTMLLMLLGLVALVWSRHQRKIHSSPWRYPNRRDPPYFNFAGLEG
jgi:hypothetical protein